MLQEALNEHRNGVDTNGTYNNGKDSNGKDNGKDNNSAAKKSKDNNSMDNNVAASELIEADRSSFREKLAPSLSQSRTRD